MTVKKTSEDQVSELAWGKGTKTYRLVLLGVAMAATPMGQNVLKSIGITTPAMTETIAMQIDLKSIKEDMAGLKTDSLALKGDILSLKANNTIIQTKVDTLDQVFRGFQVDFNKWKPADKTP